jgi:hypothetical protein
VNAAQRALLARLRELVIETPASGALNAGKKPYHPTRFAQAVERRAEDGAELVKYVRAKVYAPATDGYDALIEAGRPDLTVEAVVADADAPWAAVFSDDDRFAASERLGTMLEADRAKRASVEAAAVGKDRRIVALMNERRAGEGKPPLTPEQEAQILARLTAKRAASA